MSKVGSEHEKKEVRQQRGARNEEEESKEGSGEAITSESTDFVLLPASQARKAIGVCANTLRNWDRSGKLTSIRTPTNLRVYNIPRNMLLPEMQREMEHKLHSAATAVSTTSQQRQNQRNRKHGTCKPNALSYIYTRVSSPKQAKAGDLQRQTEEIQNYEGGTKYKDHQVLSDIASGINWKRRSLQTLLELSSRGMVKEIVTITTPKITSIMNEKNLHKTLWRSTPYLFVGNKDCVQQPIGDLENTSNSLPKILRSETTKKSKKRKMSAGPSSRIRVKMTLAMKAMSVSELAEHVAKKANEINRTLNLRIYPNKMQSMLLLRWMGHARYWYNQVVEDYRFWKAQETQVPDWKKRLITLPILRELRQSRIRSGNPIYGWYDRDTTRNEVIEAAIEAAVDHRKEVISRNIEGYLGHRNHNLKFRSKKQLTQTITIRQKKIKDGIMPYSSFLYSKEILSPDHSSNLFRLKSQTPSSALVYPGHVEHRKPNHHWPNEAGGVMCDSTITYRRQLGTFTFNWVYTKQRMDAEEATALQLRTQQNQDLHRTHCAALANHASGNENQIPSLVCSNRASRIIAMDPGVRTFLTWYSPNGECGKVADKSMGRIARLCHYMDNLQSRKDKLRPNRQGNSRKRRRMKFALARMRRKIKSLVDDVHWQTIHWLTTNYDTIILPDFDPTQMSQRGRDNRRKISNDVVRKMMTWAHCRFRDRLISKLGEYRPECGKVLLQPNEACTSITCGRCGVLNRGLGGRHVFRCRSASREGCGMVMDRDLNGARNIMLRALVDYALEEPIFVIGESSAD